MEKENDNSGKGGRISVLDNSRATSSEILQEKGKENWQTAKEKSITSFGISQFKDNFK